MSIDVQAIRDVVSCSESQLRSVIEKYEIITSVAMAKVIRTHWTRRVTNKCVHCGRLAREGQCNHCRLPAPPAFELLRELKPNIVLIRTRCATCSETMSFRVGHILKVTEQYGFFRPPKDCPSCKANRVEQVTTLPTQDIKNSSKKKNISKVKPKVRDHKQQNTLADTQKSKRLDQLSYQPFRVLESFKIEK